MARLPKVSFMERTQAHTATMPSRLNACCCIARLMAQAAREDDGVAAIEYGLLAALIAVVCVGAFEATGTSLAALYEYWSAAVILALRG